MDRRGVPARQARQGPGLRADQAEERHERQGRRQGLQRRRQGRDGERRQADDAVPLQRRLRLHLHGRRHLRPDPRAPRSSATRRSTCSRTRAKPSSPDHEGGRALHRAAGLGRPRDPTYTGPGLQGGRSTGGTKPRPSRPAPRSRCRSSSRPEAEVKVDTRDGSLPRSRQLTPWPPAPRPEARPRPPLRGRAAPRVTRSPARVSAWRADDRGAAVEVHRRPRHGSRRALEPDRRADRHVLAGLDPRADAGRRPRDPAPGCLRGALLRRRARAVAISEWVASPGPELSTDDSPASSTAARPPRRVKPTLPRGGPAAWRRLGSGPLAVAVRRRRHRHRLRTRPRGRPGLGHLEPVETSTPVGRARRSAASTLVHGGGRRGDLGDPTVGHADAAVVRGPGTPATG